MSPSRLSLAPCLALALALAAVAPAAALEMMACSDAACTQDCVKWNKDSGECSGGTSPAWISSKLTLGDGNTATWEAYQDSASKQDCSGAKLFTAPKLSLDGKCNAISSTGPSITVTNIGGLIGIIVGIILIIIAVRAKPPASMRRARAP